MKISFIGNFSIPYSLDSYCLKAFEKLGHTVIQFQENKTNCGDIMLEATTSDMLFWVHSHGFKIDKEERVLSMLRQLKELNAPTVGYNLDLFLGLHREKDLKTDPYWNIEHFFTTDKNMAEALATPNRKCYYLPSACPEEFCYIGAPDKNKFPYDIVFTGSMNYHPEWPYRKKLIDWLYTNYGGKFIHYGSGGLPPVRGAELNTLYASAKIVIGDTLCKDFNCAGYSSDRLFESLGRGAFLIYPKIEGLENFYEKNKEVVFYDYDNFEQLKSLIDFYLLHDVKRKEISEAGLSRTKQDHTYDHRIKFLLQTLNLG